MTYRKIDLAAKVKAVRRVLGGERMNAVANAMGINRNSLALWVWRVHRSMRLSLERKNSGGNGNNGNNMVTVAMQLNKLKEKMARREKTINAMRNRLRMFKEGPAPTYCVKCGCTRFYKNGFCMVGMEHLIGVKRGKENGKIPVQKFTCVNCGNGAHLDGPVALYHWVTALHGAKKEKSRCAGRRDSSPHRRGMRLAIGM